MVYYSDDTLTIRDMVPDDAEKLAAAEREQGWHSDARKFLMRLNHRSEGRAISLVAEFLGEAAGYINIYPNSTWGAFKDCGYPEIVDFGVLEKYQRRGIGSKLMDIAEALAARYSNVVYLGVGLHSGYGSAQRMYFKRGYVPDGSGVWYNDSVCPQYSPCVNDDELVLYLSKHLD